MDAPLKASERRNTGLLLCMVSSLEAVVTVALTVTGLDPSLAGLVRVQRPGGPPLFRAAESLACVTIRTVTGPVPARAARTHHAAAGAVGHGRRADRATSYPAGSAAG